MLPLVVAGSGTKKVSIVISKSNYIIFWNRNVYFLRTGRSQNPENKSVQFFIYPRLCSMQYPSCENPSIQVTNGSNQSLNSGRCALLWLANHKTSKMTAFCRYLHYRHSSHNPEFHNVNCRLCGAIHSVDRACISVLSQVIHNVNKRKTVWTNLIFFVSYGDRILTTLGSHCFSRLLFRSLSECPANRNIIFRLYRFSFHNPIKSRLVRGCLYLPPPHNL